MSHIMMYRTISYLTELADSVRLMFLVPGELLLAGIGKIAPKAAAILAFGTGRTIVIFLFSLLMWTLILIVGLLISRFCRRTAWQLSALARTFVWRIRMFLGDLKTKLIWKFPRLFRLKSARTETVSPTEFDAVDLALLRYMSDLGPGMASSAPELGQKFRLRPAQAQFRLEELARNNMVRSVRGSTDGYENFRLTDSGLGFVTMWQKQSKSASAPRVSAVSVSKSG